MGNLVQKIDRIFNIGMRTTAIAGLLYLGSLFLSYASVESCQRAVKENRPELESKVYFEHFLNPIRFMRDNNKLIEQGKAIIRERPNSQLSYFPTTG